MKGSNWLHISQSIKRILSKVLRISGIDLTNYYYFSTPLYKAWLSAQVEAHSLWLYSSKKLGPEVNLILNLLDEGDYILDIGANIGRFSLPVAQKLNNTGLVISIEPGKEAYKAISDNIRLNNFQNIKVEHIALSSHSGVMELYFSKQYSNLNSLKPINENNKENKYEIKVETGNSVIKKYKRSPKYMKIDVEGAEMEVLKGFDDKIISHIEILIIECSVDNLGRFGVNVTDLFKYFEDRGFYIYVFINNKLLKIASDDFKWKNKDLVILNEIGFANLKEKGLL